MSTDSPEAAAERTRTLDRAEEARREARVRGRLARQGLSVRKDRARSWSVDHHGGYMLVDASTDVLVGGPRYDLTLDELEKWADDGLRIPRASRA